MNGYIIDIFDVGMIHDFPCNIMMNDITDYITDWEEENIKDVVNNLKSRGYSCCIKNKVLSEILGVKDNFSGPIVLKSEDVAVLIKYKGKTILEGSKKVPEKSEIQIYKIEILEKEEII